LGTGSSRRSHKVNEPSSYEGSLVAENGEQENRISLREEDPSDLFG
jgi:hypothetical protein